MLKRKGEAKLTSQAKLRLLLGQVAQARTRGDKESCTRHLTLKGFITVLSLLKRNVGPCKKLRPAKCWTEGIYSVQLAPFLALYGECPFDDHLSQCEKGWIPSGTQCKTLLERRIGRMNYRIQT